MVVETKLAKTELSERVAREKEALLSASPRMDIDRIKIMLEVFEETDGQPPIIRKAKPNL